MADKVSKDELSEIDTEIIELLTGQDDPISTYQVAKKVDISWSTANTHLKDLQIKGLAKSKEEMSKGKKTRVWWIEQGSLDKFI